MEQTHSRDDILRALRTLKWGTVSTLHGKKVRARTMHFAVDDDFNFYFATMKGDPKTVQILENPVICLLFAEEKSVLTDSWETEVVGRAVMVNDSGEREAALKLLLEPSPIVKNAHDAGASGIFQVFKVMPETVKYRVFGEIIRGVLPTVIPFEEQAEPAGVARNYSGFHGIVEGAKLWVAEARAPFLTASIIPVILGSVIAWASKSHFNWGLFWLTLVGGVLLHVGTNVANDYFDHKSGTDDVNTEYVRPFTGGSRMIQRGLLTPREVLTEALVCFGAGSAIGLYLAWLRGWPILALGVIGVFSGYFYTAPPFKLVYRGIGEIFVGMNFGVLMTLGAYFVQTGSFSWGAAFAGIPVGLLIAAVLYINQFPDYNADKSVGKNHIVARLGRKKAVVGYEVMMMAVYGFIIVGVATRILPVFSLLGLITFPTARKAVMVARKHYADSVFLVPANANTVLAHLFTGLLLSLGYLITGLISLA